MADWRSSKWGDVVTLEYGKALRGYSDKPGAYRVFGSNGPIGWTNEPLVYGPGVILGRKGAYRGVRFSSEPFFVIDTAYYVRPKADDLDLRWLYYAIVYHKLGEIDDGSPIPSTTRAAVYVRDIEVPTLNEQRAIASILGALDDKIELNRRMNQTLDAMARAIFNDWFVDFGPTRAKMEGREPYLQSELWSFFPERLDPEALPEGWTTCRLLDLCELKRGYDLPTSKRQEGPFPIVSSSGISGTHVCPMASGPGVVTGRYGTIGEVFYIEGDFWPLNTALYVSDFKGAEPRFIYYLLSGLDFTTYSDKGAVPGINRNHLHEHSVTRVPREAQKLFAELLGPSWLRQQLNHNEIRTLTTIRDLLLPKLMSGEIRVRDAEKALEAAQ